MLFVTKLGKYAGVVMAVFSLVSLVLLKVARYDLPLWTLSIFLVDWALLFSGSIVVAIAAMIGFLSLGQWMEKEKSEMPTIEHGIALIPFAFIVFALVAIPFMIWERAREAMWEWETVGIVIWYIRYPETPGYHIDRVVYPLIIYSVLVAIPWFFAKFDGQIKKLIINFG